MSNLKAILVDDEATSLRSLKYELETYCEGIEVIETFQDPVLAISGIEKLKPDVVFLDIEMPVMNGFDVLQSFRTIDFDVIFVTAYDEFAINAFEFNAVDYLLKPVLKTKLIQSVRKVAERKEHSFGKADLEALLHNIQSPKAKTLYNSIAIPTSEGFEFIPIENIAYLTAESNYTWFNLVSKEKHLISKTLKEVQALIDSPHFFRAHKSYLVNMNHVRKYVRGRGGYLVMSDQAHIPVSRSQKQELMDWLGSN